MSDRRKVEVVECAGCLFRERTDDVYWCYWTGLHCPNRGVHPRCPMHKRSIAISLRRDVKDHPRPDSDGGL